jgi:hypothetical protein
MTIHIRKGSLSDDQGAFVCALVNYVRDSAAPDDTTLGGNGAMNGQALFAVYELDPVDAGLACKSCS